jgi:CSLREA domain-containing protein
MCAPDTPEVLMSRSSASFSPARLVSLGVFLLAALSGCDNSPLPTALGPDAPVLAQVASAPVVNSLADPGDGVCDAVGIGDGCTLREALAFASSGATITFSVTGTIVLDRAFLNIDKGLTISGPGAQQLVVNANSGSRVFSVSSGPVTIAGITITGGVTPYTGGGAGILNWGELTVRDCVITGNDSYPNWGGGIRHGYGTLTVVSSTISGNNGHTKYGSGITNSAELTVLNSTMSGNTSSAGGLATGIYTYGAGETSIAHSTITGHSTGILSEGGAVGAVKVKGSILWGNSTADAAGSAGTVTSLGYNLVGGGGETVFNATGDVVNVADALLGTLQLNSPGTTPTHALLTGSPAIDTGTCNDHAGAAVTTDQRGISRPQGAACDKGAYEWQATGSTPPSFSFDLSGLAAKTYGDAPFSVAGYVSTNSNGTLTFATGAGSVGCAVTTGGVVNLTGAAVAPAACMIAATLAPDSTYTGAGPISQSFHIAKAAGSVTISNLPASGAVGSGFEPIYTTASDGTTSTTSNTPDVCTVSAGGLVSFDAAGTCTLVASVTEGSNWLAATGTEQSVTVSLTTPTFTFDLATLPAKTYGDASFSVAGSPYVTTTSTGAVTFATGIGSAGCSVTLAGTVTITGAATGSSYCILEATLAPDGTYAGSGPIAQQFHIAKAAGSVTINNFPASGVVGGSFTPTYTKAGDGIASTVSNSSGICTVTDGVVNFIAAGTCLLQASVTEGTNHLAATGSEQSVLVSPPAPPGEFTASCTFTLHPKNGQRQATVAWENAVPGVTLIQLTDGRTVTKQMAPTSTGAWSTTVKTDPTYELRGGDGRKDTSVVLVPATPCEGPN